jgi:acyl-CoA synthetase (AMP-forming)/AMP-acid ligase II
MRHHSALPARQTSMTSIFDTDLDKNAANFAALLHCRALLAAYKLPRDVRFEPLAKTSTGKIQKFALRERAKETP